MFGFSPDLGIAVVINLNVDCICSAINYVPSRRRNRRRNRRVTKLSDYLRISEAAEYLGVSPNTLRNWERAGKIVAHRHPVNDYRLFQREDLDA